MKGASDRIRLDQALVDRGMVISRARARDLILRGDVAIAGVTASKPAQLVGPADALSLLSGDAAYVSRGALKLAAALAHFGLDAAGRTAVDIGASTGGFTETLLAAGAIKVYAVENGRGQLHPRLLADARVVSLENCDARRLDASVVDDPIGAVVADVSFISLTKVLPAVLTLAAPGCWLAALIKPQFEAGPGAVPRDGIVKDPRVIERVLEEIRGWVAAQPGWMVLGTIPSPIQGGHGNTEYLIGAVREH